MGSHIESEALMSTEPDVVDPFATDDPDSPPPTTLGYSKRVQVDVGARSHIGLVRTNNEDHFVVSEIRRSIHVTKTNLPTDVIPTLPDELGYAFAIADGMGGMASGEEASQLALVSGLELVRDASKWNMRFTDPAEVAELNEKLKAYFLEVNRRVSSRAATSSRLEGMGTTLIVAYSVGQNLFVVHAGDSRGYLFHDDHLQHITKDHTLAQYLHKAGQVREDELATHRLRHVLTNYVGNPNGGIHAEIHRMLLADGDRLLLCSDGLSDVVEHGRIEREIRNASSAASACDALVEAALEAGGRDNITVVVAEYRIGGK